MNINYVVGIDRTPIGKLTSIVTRKIGNHGSRPNFWSVNIYVKHHRTLAAAAIGMDKEACLAELFVLFAFDYFGIGKVVLIAANWATQNKAEPTHHFFEINTFHIDEECKRFVISVYTRILKT